MRLSTINLISLFVPFVFAVTTPPSGALIVGTSSSAKYKTLQAAVTAAASGATIFIEAGTYKEQVYIPAGKNDLKIIGYSATDTTYTGNEVIITQGLAQDAASKPNNDGTATLRAWGDGLKLYNVNLVNSRGSGSQALALSAYGDKLGFYGCQFTSFQDTVMSQKGTHFIGKSLIIGATDFIFGQYGILWIEKSVLQVVIAKIGYVTGKCLSLSFPLALWREMWRMLANDLHPANGRIDASNPSYYVINNSNITGTSAVGSYYLGRPWRNYARVVFQNTAMNSVINKLGWSVWQTADPRTDKVTFAEYNNTGAGAAGPRASFAKTASSAVTIETIFGSSSWVDAAFL